MLLKATRYIIFLVFFQVSSIIMLNNPVEQLQICENLNEILIK